MSGGSYDYVSYRLTDAASTLRSRHPEQAHVVALAAHLDRLATVMHDIEWADSMDTSWTPELDTQIRDVLLSGVELSATIEQAITVRDALDTALRFTVARGGLSALSRDEEQHLRDSL